MVSHRASAPGTQGKSHVQLAQASAPRWRWARRAATLSVLAGVFAAGILLGRANHGWASVLSAIASKLTHLTGPVQLGIAVFLTAVAAAVITMTRLAWQAGKQVIDGATSQQEKERAYNLVAATLLKVLRVSGRNAIFTQEPDLFPEQNSTHRIGWLVPRDMASTCAH
jgi:hypothetical protein